MKHGKTLLVAFSLLAFAGAPAYANEAGAKKEPFTKLDKDGDGALSRAEAAADVDAKSRFERLDTNRDQKLSMAEYQAWASAGQAGAKTKAADGINKASALIGKDVVGKSGEQLGEIEDVVINLNGGKVHAAVLEFGGTLGMGEKHYAFPVSQLKPGKSSDQLVLNVDKEKLKNAEGFAKGEWPAMNDEYWGRVGGQASAGATAKKQNLKLVRASDMIGKEIQGKNGNEVGEIDDLAISLKDGSVRNVIVDVKDAGQAVLQVSTLKTGTGDKLLVDMSHDQLKKQAQQNQARR